MKENNLTNGSQKKSMLTVKNILRVFSLLCIIFVFCPSFLVSCSGQNVNVSVMTAVAGVSAYGNQVVDPYPIMLVCLLIPIAVFVLLFVKKFTDNKIALTILVCTVVDFVIWLIFRSSVKKIAEDNYCTFKTTGWYVINIIVILIMILLSALVVMKKMQMDTDLLIAFSGGGTQSAMNQMVSVVTQLADNVASNINNKSQKENAIGFCSKCGSPITYGHKFCTSCGTPVPDSMLAEAEAAKKVAEEAAGKEEKRIASESAKGEQDLHNNSERPMFCQQCGVKLEANAVFCESCGTKIE